jgi:hypothetical protein
MTTLTDEIERRVAQVTAADREAIEAAVTDLTWARSVLREVIAEHAGVLGDVPGIAAFVGLDQHTDPDGHIVAELTRRTATIALTACCSRFRTAPNAHSRAPTLLSAPFRARCSHPTVVASRAPAGCSRTRRSATRRR